ncbi:MAG: serine/threonine protein kinase [Pseudonocardia sp.]|uniref:serine/threonine-protein kinase n=1 Tax=Pseudonocardia sp. TaxID=60912 RepID=UPI001AD1DDCE|nr:serine/threonine-protein kinase [Pseudonocardia sp.]MBN9100393.1 serine/threonine protein kinase [Pseudonocardia sp.]
MTPGEHATSEPDDHAMAGRYELGPVIGVGSSAVVRRGRDRHDGEPVAVKMFHPGSSAADLRQQRQEVRALSQLDHPGLVGLHDAGSEDGRPYVVTDLVEGPTLAERIKDGPLAVATVLRIAGDLADALAHVHDCGIVHRDIKPANVLLGDGTQARLADFGISQSADGTASTEAGCVIGTAAYLAPEQARGEEVGPPADVYALGLVLLEALTGRREYPGLAVESATARLHRRPLVPEGLPGGLTPLLRAMTSDDPAARPEAAVVASLLTPQREPRPVGRHRRPERSRRPVVLAAAALVLVVAGGGTALALHAAPDGAPAPVAGQP